MDRSRNLIIILIVIILILIIALVGAMAYIFMNQDNNNNNNGIVVDNSVNSGNVVDSEDEEDANNISNTTPSDEEVENPEDSEETETPEEQEQPQEPETPSQGTDDMDKLIFNTAFMSYVGNINGDRLNSLLQVIQDSNTKYPEHQITLSSNNLSDLNGIGSTDIYTITLSYDDNGYINNINIDKQIQ